MVAHFLSNDCVLALLVSTGGNFDAFVSASFRVQLIDIHEIILVEVYNPS